MKILIVGGYGIFGGRLVDLLVDEPRLQLVVAGRSLDKARAFCSARPHARARLLPALFDRDADVESQLSALAPDVVVDASGPWQAYGEGGYRLIEACISARMHYLDLADSSDFVAGVAAFDAAARAAGVSVLSGVSSFPVLTAAIVRQLSVDMARIVSIRGGIAPSPFAVVGENVIRAIAAYAGQAITLRRGARDACGFPFTETLRYTIAPPGRVPLNSTLFSLVDVPDLRQLSALWPEVEEVWMGAGPVPESLHRALIGLSWLVRWRLLPSVSPLARLMHFVMKHARWGEHRGGMFVEVAGVDAGGQAIKRSFHLLAEGNDGPMIPSMAIEAIVRRALESGAPAPGARAATRELELASYEAAFANRTIHTGTRDDCVAAEEPLFARLLGDAWHRVPAPIRQLHSLPAGAIAHGSAQVERGSGRLANAVASLFGFPRAADELPVVVQFQSRDGVEAWTRRFGRETFSSTLYEGRGRSARLLVERFGPMAFAQALVLDGGRLRLVLRRWSLLGVPLPLFLAPRSHSHEHEQGGRFHFHVEISLPWLGLLVRYRGDLSPTPTR